MIIRYILASIKTFLMDKRELYYRVKIARNVYDKDRVEKNPFQYDVSEKLDEDLIGLKLPDEYKWY